MKFKSLLVESSRGSRYIEFSDETTLIFSRANSVGKSTLLRILFYSLGYNIPGTQKVKFHKLRTVLDLEIKNVELNMVRSDKKLSIASKGKEATFILPDEQDRLLKFLFDNDNMNVLSNILGAFYLDQDKGWTLLNRGVVIGSIRFNIENLVAGLAEVDISSENQLLEVYEQQLRKFKSLQDVVEFQRELSKDNILNLSEVEKLNDRISILAARKRVLQKKISDLEKTIKSNEAFISQLEQLRLKVVAPESGEKVLVTKDTIEGYGDNTEYTEMRKWTLKEEILKLDSEIRKAQSKQIELQGQLDLFNSKDEIARAESLIQNVKIDPAVVSGQIEILKNDIKGIKEKRELKLNNQSTVVNEMSSLIHEYAVKFNVEEYLLKTENLVFTNSLKDLSGTILHKLVLSFKLAYIKMIEKYLGIKLPLVMDSPTGREITQENVREMMQVVEIDFSDNQKIIASIYENIVNYGSVVELNEQTKLFSDL